jgi:hypothetical protein
MRDVAVQKTSDYNELSMRNVTIQRINVYEQRDI